MNTNILNISIKIYFCYYLRDAYFLSIKFDSASALVGNTAAIQNDWVNNAAAQIFTSNNLPDGSSFIIYQPTVCGKFIFYFCYKSFSAKSKSN